MLVYTPIFSTCQCLHARNVSPVPFSLPHAGLDHGHVGGMRLLQFSEFMPLYDGLHVVLCLHVHEEYILCYQLIVDILPSSGCTIIVSCPHDRKAPGMSQLIIYNYICVE